MPIVSLRDFLQSGRFGEIALAAIEAAA